MAKIYCNEMSIRVTSEAIQVHGGYGFTDEFAVSRFFRGTRYGSLGGGTTETLRNLVGQASWSRTWILRPACWGWESASRSRGS